MYRAGRHSAHALTSHLAAWRGSARHYSTTAPSDLPVAHFAFIPGFLDAHEQRVLLRACLEKLDATESREHRKRRRLHLTANPGAVTDNTVDSMFFPDEFYDFQEASPVSLVLVTLVLTSPPQGHVDGVIRFYREMHVSNWPSSPELERILCRIQDASPDGRHSRIQSHILHLSSAGFIDPHVDNVQSSGSWILGVSLGAARDMLLQSLANPQQRLQLELPSGSLYVQR